MPQPPFDVKLSSLQPDGSPGGEATLSSEELRYIRAQLFHCCPLTPEEEEMHHHILFVLDCFV